MPPWELSFALTLKLRGENIIDLGYPSEFGDADLPGCSLDECLGNTVECAGYVSHNAKKRKFAPEERLRQVYEFLYCL